MPNKNIVYIGIGSNQGDKLTNIKKAITSIEKLDSTNVGVCSSIYLTKPYGYLDQDDFLNMVIKISTEKDLALLHRELNKIEDKIGRNKTIKWGPRQIDLDILFFNDIIYTDDQITVPHKGIIKRDFVMVPLIEIDSNLIHPALNLKIADICNNVSQKQIISKFKFNYKSDLVS
ncbi:MAG: 2-amino-4-hydroxy-6-hydroxymethyldihydropteridine diphosphokinase [Ignavibacteriales bacterium CG12_big_fil_rev_8_21_14_0_65_30_8]|nr:MAG: 2-amino-4-hydroxy-6-hydroxymethyldihydropteridine diphosphokinase [Ignavibacteriales bacterium CG12_big_fil_rev_8_21_14_0_65_30_8]